MLAFARPVLGAPDPDAEAEPEEKGHILIVGDSMIAGGFGIVLERDLRKEHGYSTERRGKSSSGLARPDFFDWMEEARRLVEERKPDVSVVMFGGNDVQGLYHTRDMRKGGAPKWLKWSDDKWPEEYARRVNEFCDILSPEDQQIFWVGLPIMRPDNFRSKCEKVNTIYRAEMAIRKDATFIDTWSVLADKDRNYADSICLEPPEDGSRCKTTRVRASDGIHINAAGSHHMKRHVLEVMLPALGIS
jgi:hypothetical protein